MRSNDHERGVSRRRFLGGATGVVAATAAGPLLSRGARAERGGGRAGRDVLVHVFLRGGMDGLTTCAPYGDGDLYTARPTLAIQPPGSTNGAVDLDGFFGLAPAAAPLLTPFAAGKLAIVHAAGSTDPTRSHFSAFKVMEFGIPNQPLSQVSSGWLARHLQVTPPLGTSPLRAVALASVLPQTLAAAPRSLPIQDLDQFAFPGDPATAALREGAVRAMYDDEAPPVGPAAITGLDSIALLASIDFANYLPTGGAVYPTTEFGTQMAQTAALIKADVDVEAIMLEYGHWDLHNQLGPISGDMAANLDDLARGLEAFYLDTLGAQDRVTVLVMSEFGRRVGENGSAGLDHGHGNCMLVMGGHIAGGQVYGTWPGLAPAQLDNGDLAVTTDYRDVVAELLQERLGNGDLAATFPNHTPSFLGLTA